MDTPQLETEEQKVDQPEKMCLKTVVEHASENEEELQAHLTSNRTRISRSTTKRNLRKRSNIKSPLPHTKSHTACLYRKQLRDYKAYLRHSKQLDKEAESAAIRKCQQSSEQIQEENGVLEDASIHEQNELENIFCLWKNGPNVRNLCVPVYRAGFCPKSAGNCNVKREMVDIINGVIIKRTVEPEENIEEPSCHTASSDSLQV